MRAGGSTLRNEFAWSFSRHRSLLACPRRYWFERYGHWGGWDRDADPRTREIYRLGKLQTRATWKGSVIHAAIASALRAAQQGRPVEDGDVDGRIEAVVVRMRADYRDSREDRARRTGDFKRSVRFLEHEDDPDDSRPGARQRWKQVAEEVEAALRLFFRSRLHGRLKALPAGDWLEIEDPALPPATVAIEDVPAYVKLDCAFREDGRPVVVDWKTGRMRQPATPVQLATYAVALAQRHGVDPEQVVAREVNVVTGDVVEHDVGPDALDAFRGLFAESVARMRSYLADVADNVPRPEGDFPFTEDDRECRNCSFRSACPKITPAF